MHRLTRAGLRRGDALASVGTDRLVGALGLAAFVGFAGAGLPWRMLAARASALAVGALVGAAGRPSGAPRPGCPRQPLPRPRQLAHGLLLSAGYQLTIAGCCWARSRRPATRCPRSALLGAFGASQIAGAVPGPNGASPRDAALVVALAALGLPWAAAAAAVALKAAVAWLPGARARRREPGARPPRRRVVAALAAA